MTGLTIAKTNQQLLFERLIEAAHSILREMGAWIAPCEGIPSTCTTSHDQLKFIERSGQLQTYPVETVKVLVGSDLEHGGGALSVIAVY